MLKLNLKNRIVVAMSGGVDSSVAAALLKRQGFSAQGGPASGWDVVGIMLKFWSEKGGNKCCSTESEKLARLVAKKIGIPFYVINAEKEFKKKVVDYFIKEYKVGRTPNPCVVCNKEIKFGFLIKKALALGADFVATGHYARTSLGGNSRSAINFFPVVGNPLCACGTSGPRPAKSLLPRSVKLFTGNDKEKDQSYFLWQLNQKQLSHVLFPVGGYTKSEVRKLAKKFKLPTAETPESQEVCFVSSTTNNFLKKYLKTKPGDIVDVGGKKIGKHNGLWFYTIGQRKGIEVQQGPWYVVNKNFKKNLLVISKNKNDLLKEEFIAKEVNWISGKEPKMSLSVEVKIRYKSDFAKAVIHKLNNKKVKIVFKNKQKAITPGQSAVFYAPVRSLGAKEGKKKELLGGGIIEEGMVDNIY